MDLATIKKLSEADMNAVDKLIMAQLQSDVALINQLGLYIISGGGKRLRPLLAVLSARALGYQGKHHHTLAAVIEFIHTSTLLHDDVVDESNMRRGRATANAKFGNEASVLVGDFLYSRAFQLMVSMESMRVMDVLADATNVIAEGEVMQLMNCNDPETTEERYFAVIYSKTARLFEAATQLGAVLAGQDQATEEAMQAYGRHLGTAFQLVDDILDYTADADAMGKEVGDDLAEGKPTLPLLYAMWHGGKEESTVIRNAIEHGGQRDRLPEVMQTMQSTGAIKYAQQRAQQETDKAKEAIQALPETEYKAALLALADIAAARMA
ncbi:octaprenyl diphosphate synthase [Aliidiomarina minuta]|uniref:Octaprenyl diphosphate synthase n=1 Tax=Aliidiomarina minuta TaxID=880057 RepID=A0A432WAE4_9GAMM|nr:octaprenyl diphosphate synthase [Aliidiomarina minuta]RUO27127.1 octaprenyl diphosphate synthase [Aliidiomarina minuta]